MLNKENCFSLFQNVRINGKQIYQENSFKSQLEFKFNYHNRVADIKGLKFLINFGVKGHYFIFAILKLLEIEKEMFVLNLEQGVEAIIPKQLRQDDLPMSFRFYDPILRIIDKFMPNCKKEYFNLKN